LVVTFAIAGTWYVRVHRATGSWTGVADDVAARHMSLLQKFAQLPHVNWKSGALSILISHLWFGAWSFLRVPDVIYVLAFVLLGGAIVGFFVRLGAQAHSRQRNPCDPRVGGFLSVLLGRTTL
jgi:hypothetical protein